MVASPGKDPKQIVKKNPNYQPLNALSAIEAFVDQVLKKNAQSVADFKAGKASPSAVNDLLNKNLKELD